MTTMNLSTLRRIDVCPLCGCPEADPQRPAAPNLYSEMLAAQLGVEERDLLAQVVNVQCRECTVIFKRHWFPPAVLRSLFTERVPAHPKGWDVLSGRFTAESFQREVTALEDAMQRGERARQRRFQRSLTSIVESISGLEGTAEGTRLVGAITGGDIASLRAAQPLLLSKMGDPAPYKRFAGFSSRDLWDYVQSVVGPIEHYAEVGCPLWGLIPRALQAGGTATFLDREELNFWSPECRQGGVQCADHLVACTGARRVPWMAPDAAMYSVVGVFQYLDHIEEPRRFLAELLRRAKAVAIILDAVDDGLALQHFTGWTSTAMRWLAQANGCRLREDFADIRPSGSILYLLTSVSA